LTLTTAITDCRRNQFDQNACTDVGGVAQLSAPADGLGPHRAKKLIRAQYAFTISSSWTRVGTSQLGLSFRCSGFKWSPFLKSSHGQPNRDSSPPDKSAPQGCRSTWGQLRRI